MLLSCAPPLAAAARAAVLCAPQCRLISPSPPVRSAFSSTQPHSRQQPAAQRPQMSPVRAQPTLPQQGVEVRPEQEVEGMSQFLDSLKWDGNGLLAAIVQHVDTGELLMQAFADRAAVSETMQTGLATFYSRSRKGRWCKGETSGHYLQVVSVHADCDRDSLVYLSDPIGPACHTGAPSCWFSDISVDGQVVEQGHQHSRAASPLPTLLALERTIAARRNAADASSSWTAKLLSNQELLCKKVREEAGELCETLEKSEGRERTISEAADLLYHASVLLATQDVSIEEVMRELRRREGTSGIAEKAARSQV